MGMTDNQSLEVVVKLECYLTYTYPLYGWQKVIHMAIPVCYALMWLPCVALNFAALQVYLKKKFRSRVSNLFILNTIIADLLTGLVFIPLALSHYILIVYFTKTSCAVYLSFMFAGFVFTVVSFLMISFAATDRYLAIFKPYLYSAKLAQSSSLYYSIMVLTWLFSVSLVGSSFSTRRFTPVMYFLLFQPVVVLVHFFVNIKLWLAVRQLRETIRRQLRSSETVQPSVYHIENSKISEKEHMKSNTVKDTNSRSKNVNNFRRMPITVSNSKFSNQSSIAQHRTAQLNRKNRKSIRVMLFMLMSICICYLPYFATNIVWRSVKEDLDSHYTIGTIAAVFVVLKSVLNPIIYCYSMPSVKREMKRLVFFWRKNKLSSRSARINSETGFTAKREEAF